MNHKKISSRLLIQDRHLGNLIYDEDKNGYGYLKFTFAEKIADLKKGTDAKTILPVPLKLEEPIRVDLSYKFQNEEFMVKKIARTKTTYEVYSAPLPAKSILFYLRIKDWQLLPLSNKPSELILNPPNDTSDIVIIFSFPGANGVPYTIPPYIGIPMGEITFPGSKERHLYIGIAPDYENNSLDGLRIFIPLEALSQST